VVWIATCAIASELLEANLVVGLDTSFNVRDLRQYPLPYGMFVNLRRASGFVQVA